MRARLKPLIAILWPAAVLIAYLAYNLAYFEEKIATFGPFFLGLLS
ncbi:MAG: hypothetical protein HY521_03450 [Proteobacteria bacterium]|nr:hypothetical protein [Pseudomonadota bacterium]